MGFINIKTIRQDIKGNNNNAINGGGEINSNKFEALKFEELKDAIRDNVSSPVDKEGLLKIVDEMDAVKENEGKFSDALLRFLDRGAQYMNYIAPFIPYLMPLVGIKS